jgi:cobalt transporter subunit CbtB
MTTATHTAITGRDTGLSGIFLAVGLGFGLLVFSGFAQATVLHDAAHDQRHAMAFPCH